MSVPWAAFYKKMKEPLVVVVGAIHVIQIHPSLFPGGRSYPEGLLCTSINVDSVEVEKNVHRTEITIKFLAEDGKPVPCEKRN